MKTWKIKSVHYYSHDEKRRDIEFDLNGVTIITGQSSTGKSAVIDTVNYCLGSSDCDIGSFIEARCSNVAILLTNANEELFICRKIPKPGQKVSTLMQVINAGKVVLPQAQIELKVDVSKDVALQSIQAALNIGEVKKAGNSESKISVRNIVPYIFLNDEVIINKRLALYGLEHKKAKNVIDSYPYFIGAIDEETLELERELYSLKKAVENEANRLEKSKKELLTKEKDADDILLTAVNLALIDEDVLYDPFETKIDFLKTINEHTHKKPPSKSNSLFNDLTSKKKKIIKQLNSQEEELKSASLLRSTSTDFTQTLTSQKDNLSVSRFFKNEYESSKCPVCDNQLPEANEILATVNQAFKSVTKEIEVAKKRIPKIESYVDNLITDVEQTKSNLTAIERQLELLVEENEELAKIEDRSKYIERLKGQITFYLRQQERDKTPVLDNRKFTEYSNRVAEIEQMLDPALIEEQIIAADNEISNHASEILARLPTAIPCKGNSIHFSSRNMSISILEQNGSLIPMNKIKSDQNYLAIHVSLILGLQQELQKRNRPVPGFVFIDQISRPYYPAEKFKNEIRLDMNDQDKEVSSVKSYFDLLFAEAERHESLQIIVLEHAYFENYEKFKKSVKYRWTDETGEALIPLDWPVY